MGTSWKYANGDLLGTTWGLHEEHLGTALGLLSGNFELPRDNLVFFLVENLGQFYAQLVGSHIANTFGPFGATQGRVTVP